MTTNRFILTIAPLYMIALAILLSLLILPDMLSATAPHPASPEGSGIERIEEDDPRWDCATMGNRICGPLAPRP